MKSVLISTRPNWCEKICHKIGENADGTPIYEKGVEVRKTRPKLDTPFKVYIYCTKPRHYYKISRHLLISDESLFLINGNVRMCDGFGVEYEDSEYKHLNCKVIGEFVCDKVFDIYEFSGSRFWLNETLVNATCLTEKEIHDYGKGKDLYGWHISDLVIYDKPRELSEFYKLCEKYPSCDESCEHFAWTSESGIECQCDFKCPIERPPQSWCYVEEVTGDENVR